jgi:hypothetical protein
VKLRDLLKNFRRRPSEDEGERPLDDVHALESDAIAGQIAVGPDSDRRPPNWMPSQQDERPRY